MPLDAIFRSLNSYPHMVATSLHAERQLPRSTRASWPTAPRPFAAFDVLDGTVIGHCMQRHRHQEFIRFLNAIERAVPSGRVIHVILDNYATHKHPKVLRWLSRHPRFVFYFTPTLCSWLNAVETFFCRLIRRRLRRGVFRSIVDLQAAINRFIEDHNAKPKPFGWTADPDIILHKVARGTQAFTGDVVDWWQAALEGVGPAGLYKGKGVPAPRPFRVGAGRLAAAAAPPKGQKYRLTFRFYVPSGGMPPPRTFRRRW